MSANVHLSRLALRVSNNVKINGEYKEAGKEVRVCFYSVVPVLVLVWFFCLLCFIRICFSNFNLFVSGKTRG